MPPSTSASLPGTRRLPALHASGVHLRLGEKTILAGVDLCLTSGSVHALLGPNGAGKSSLLHCLTGERSMDRGDVALFGRQLGDWDLAELARCRAVVPQHSSLAFPLSALEVVLLGRCMHSGRGDSERDHEVAFAALDKVGLTSKAHLAWPALSGGERQRVHFARALAQIAEAPPHHALLLLDEPTASLDPAHQHLLLEMASEQARVRGVAVVAVLHDVNLARVYADAASVLRNGRLLASGSAEAVLTPSVLSEAYGTPCAYSDQLPPTHAQLVLGPEAALRHRVPRRGMNALGDLP